MTYSLGSVIDDADYNGFAASTDAVWGAGSGTNGYGQTNTVGTVAAGATITATQWATLLTRIASAAAHSGTSISAISNPTAGSTISAYAALSTNVSAITNNNAAASGTDASATTSTTATWSSSATTSKVITFASAAAMRYFFNAGGMIRMSFSRSGGSSTTQNTSWTNLLASSGTIVLTGDGGSKSIAGVAYTGTTKIGGSGTNTTLATSTGAYNLSGTAVTLYKQLSATYTYTSNYININATDTATTITFAVSCIDTGARPWQDTVNGTLSMVTTIRPPSTTYIANTWGTVSQNAATWATA